MITKGRHYAIACDKPECKVQPAISIVRKHDNDLKRNIKQNMLKAGWTFHAVSTTHCPACSQVKPKISTTKEKDKDGN